MYFTFALAIVAVVVVAYIFTYPACIALVGMGTHGCMCMYVYNIIYNYYVGV